MSDPTESGATGQNPDAELTPEARAVIAKARRSFAFAMGTLLLGFMAIGFAIVYRVMRDAPPPTVAESVLVPAEAEVVSAVLSDGAINVTYTLNGVTTLSLFDRATGDMTGSVVIAGQ